ncbi:hypothetical protein Tco_1482351 [Tanacetum coccineum]
MFVGGAVVRSSKRGEQGGSIWSHKNWEHARVGEKMRILLLHLIVSFLSELRTSPRVPMHFNNWDMALLKTFDLMIHDFDRLFNEMELVINLDSIQRVALLMIAGSLNTALDLNNLLSRLMDDLWASELTISNFSLVDR